MLPVIPTVLSDWESCYPGVTLDLQLTNPSRDGAGVTEALPISAFLEMSDGNILDKQGNKAYQQTRMRMYIDAQIKAGVGISISTIKSQKGDIALL